MTTLEFVQQHLKTTDLILEVGCGKGQLAKALQDLDYQIVPIDIREEVIAEAIKLGVNGLVADYLQFEGPDLFDAILFTRSLHHIQPLKRAVEKTVSLLKPGGRVIVDDFAAEEIDVATATWFYSLQAGLAKEHLAIVHGGDRDDLEPLERWRYHHFEKHKVTPFKDLESVLTQHFKTVASDVGPCLYRYFDKTDRKESHDAVESVFQWEEALIQTQTIKSIGRRWVGRK